MIQGLTILQLSGLKKRRHFFRHQTSKVHVDEVIVILLLVDNPGRLSSNPYAIFVLQRVLIVLYVLFNCHFELLYHYFHMLKLE